MPALSPHGSEVLSLLVRNSAQASVLIALIFLVQWIFRKHLAPQWRCALWLLLVARLALPLGPQSTLSIFNWIRFDTRRPANLSATLPSVPKSPDRPPAVASTPAAAKVEPPPAPGPAGAVPPAAVSPTKVPELKAAGRHTRFVLFWCWLAGVCVLALRVVAGACRLGRMVRRVRPVTDAPVLELLEDCKQLMGVTTPICIVETSFLKSPMLFGFLRPRLLLPEGMLRRFNRQELRFVFLHELAHVRRGDILVNWFVTTLQILHWFNPLIWIAFWRMRSDRELACDNLALARLERQEHAAYGDTILKLLESFARPIPHPGLVGILESRDDIKGRILAIAHFSRRRRWSTLAIAVLVLLGLATLTDAQRAAVELSRFSAGAEIEEDGGAWRRCASGPAQNGPGARVGHSVIWTGKELLVWGGGSQSVFFNDGGRYDPATDTWRPISRHNAPSERFFHAAVWTGREMIVWGGRTQFENYKARGDGARYDPATDTWRPLPARNAPRARSQMAAVWTGSEMLIWGGSGEGWVTEPTGGRYNPLTDAWEPMAEKDAPEPRMDPTVVWTGTEMIVWGGVRHSPDQIAFGTGGRYDAARDRWIPLPTNGAPSARTGHTAVWTGTEMIIWGGYEDVRFMHTGARFKVAENRWVPTTLVRAPQRRMGHAAVWTGSEMIIWGGQASREDLTGAGARYLPRTDEWRRVSNIGSPAPRFFQRPDGAVWIGKGMLIFGGGTGVKEFDSIFLWTPPLAELGRLAK